MLGCDNFGQTKESSLTSMANSLDKFLYSTRKFNLKNQNDEIILRNFLLKESLPNLILKIIGTNHEQNDYSISALIQNSFKTVLCTLMQQTNLWLLNGTRAMIDLEEEDKNLHNYDENNSDLIICEPYGKAQVFIYHSAVNSYIDEILFQIQQFESPHIPVVTLLMHGDNSSVENIIENSAKSIPTIILKGTGSIANQLAYFFSSSVDRLRTHRERSSNDQLIANNDLHRLFSIDKNKQSLIFVCQSGKDELDTTILQAITATMHIRDDIRAHTIEFNFAIKWKKLDYTQRHILNHNTIIDWTDDELNRCLEMAILANSVPFVELLFQYGASLERLALIGNPELFKIKSDERRNSGMIGVVVESFPVVIELDSDKRIKVYLRNLFDWCVDNQYFEMIMSICTRLEDSIVAILLVCQWCHYKEEHDYLRSRNYRKFRRQFEIYAADILDRYYADNEQKTIEYLHEKSLLYPDQQPLTLIDDLCSKTLISTKCMQDYMNTRWYGNYFHCEKNLQWEILICLVCFCPLLLFISPIRNRIFHWNQTLEQKNFPNRLRYIFEPFRRFYRGNAFIRFHYNVASYIAFLLLFSYTILFDYYPLNIYKEKRSSISQLPIPLTEIFLHLFLISIGLEEIHQIILHVRSSLIKSPYWKTLFEINRHQNTIWSFYKSDPWNILDFVAFTLWLVGFITRFIVRDHAFEISKICMSVDLCLWYIRCLHVFLASERLGPKLLMIFHTMRDLMLFLFFILIFLLAYTITSYSLITTSSFVSWSNSTHFQTRQDVGNVTTIEFLRNIIEWGTWRIFGSTSLTTSDSVQMKYSVRNDAYGFVTLILTVTFLVIAYVLLLNNLIALFNFTIQRVHGESHRNWCYHFYVVLKEYEDKDMFVPPLNLFLFPISCLIRKKCFQYVKNDVFMDRHDRDYKQIHRQQQRIAKIYWKEKQIDENRTVIEQTYICRECKSRGTHCDLIEMTYF